MATDESQEELAKLAQQACAEGDYDRAMTAIVHAYGAEVLRFLVARLGELSAAEEVYSEVMERLWRALPAFEWRYGVRGYCYAIARNTAIDYRRNGARRPERNLSLSGAEHASAAIAAVRTATLPFLRTEVKDRFRVLREQLSQEDQTLLMLRLDRGLDFRELAVVMTYGNEPPDDASLTREAARLRQRYKAAKERLRDYAKREGMLP